METSTVMKLIGCILIGITMIVESTKISSDKPETLTPKSPSSATTISTPANQKNDQNKIAQNQNTSTSNENKGTSSDSKKNGPDENGLPRNSQTDRGQVDIFNNPGKELQRGKAEALRSISIQEEQTGFTTKTWICITLGVLCIACVNLYVFWYRKRAATYTFEPKLKTQRR